MKDHFLMSRFSFFAARFSLRLSLGAFFSFSFTGDLSLAIILNFNTAQNYNKFIYSVKQVINVQVKLLVF
jgi:hypothetical protein